MKTPTITINGKTYTPAPPKMQVWREVLRFEENRFEILVEDFIQAHAVIIAMAFAVPEVTADAILRNLKGKEIIQIYLDVYDWISELVSDKLEKIPNAETPAAE